MKKQLLSIATIVALITVLAACGSGEGTVAEPTLSDEAQIELNTWNEEQLSFVRQRTDSEFVMAIIEDGVVTLAEAQESVTRTNACIADGLAGAGLTNSHGGFMTEELVASRGGQIGGTKWAFGSGCGVDDDCDLVVEIADDCFRRYSAGVVGIYMHGREFVGTTAAREATLACLKSEGLVADDFTIGMLQMLEIEMRWPESCEAAMNDPRVMNVDCGDDGGFGWQWNPDFVFESRLVPGAPDLNQPPARDCVQETSGAWESIGFGTNPGDLD